MPKQPTSKWSKEKLLTWKRKLTDLCSVSKEADEDWTWVLYTKDGVLHPDTLEANAEELLKFAQRDWEVRAAMESLDGPCVHHPALYWSLWQAVEKLDSQKYPLRTDSMEIIRHRPKEAEKIIGALKEAISALRCLSSGVGADAHHYEELDPIWLPGWTQSRIETMHSIQDGLGRCVDDLDEIARLLLRPLAESCLTPKQEDTKIIHELTVMVKEMTGLKDFPWQAMAILINAICKMNGQTQRFSTESLKQQDKYFKTHHQPLIAQLRNNRFIKNFLLHRDRYALKRQLGEIPESLDVDQYLKNIFSRKYPEIAQTDFAQFRDGTARIAS